MPRSFTVREKVQIYDKLLTHGRAHFAGGGLRKTTVATIAEAAGISKGGFYLFFASKEELLAEIVERFERQLQNEIIAGLDGKKSLADVLVFICAKWRSENLLAQLGPDDLLALQHGLQLKRFNQLMDIDLRIAGALLEAMQKRKLKVGMTELHLAAVLRALFTVYRHEAELGDEGVFARKTMVELVAARLERGK